MPEVNGENYIISADWLEVLAKYEKRDMNDYCYGPTSGTTFSMDLLLFFLSLILSYHFRLQTVRRFSMRTHLSHTLHIFTTCVCLMANLMPSNLTLFLTVHFCVVHGYAATYIRTPHVYASLPFCHRHVVTS